MARRKRGLVKELLAAHEPAAVERRPPIVLGEDAMDAIVEAIERAGGRIVLPLRRAVELLRLDRSYASAEKAYLLGASLSRRFRAEGRNVAVGAVSKGKYLSFRERRGPARPGAPHRKGR